MRFVLLLSAFLTFACPAQELTENLRSAGFTELHAAAWSGDVKRIKKLVASGISPSVASVSGTTPLHSAAIKDKPEAIAALVELGASLEARDNMGRTPLFVAVEVNPRPKAVLLTLLGAGASAVAEDKFGKTPLSSAWTNDAREVLTKWQADKAQR